MGEGAIPVAFYVGSILLILLDAQFISIFSCIFFRFIFRVTNAQMTIIISSCLAIWCAE